MVKFDIYITISRFMAILMVVLGFILSWFQKDQSAFITACSASGVVIAIKTGLQSYGESRKKGTSSSSTETTETSVTTRESTT